MRLPRRILGPSCPCGARLSPSDKVCRKCRARARWLRRSPATPTYDTRPAHPRLRRAGRAL
jgi:hypothetical protein